jgi:hypothetical protein
MINIDFTEGEMQALNAVTHELTTVINDTYINAQSFCDLSLFKYIVYISIYIERVYHV